MKVLAAAPTLPAGAELERCQCQPGELVMLAETCECDCHRLEDEECECHLDCDGAPPFSGLVTSAGTMTARVEERDITEPDLRAAVRHCLERTDWFGAGVQDDIVDLLVDLEVARIAEATATFAIGTMISMLQGRIFPVSAARRGHHQQARAGGDRAGDPTSKSSVRSDLLTMLARQPQGRRGVSRATHSTWWVIGNRSNARSLERW
jgi:hypothetical protein